jgi:hypothetical protein
VASLTSRQQGLGSAETCGTNCIHDQKSALNDLHSSAIYTTLIGKRPKAPALTSPCRTVNFRPNALSKSKSVTSNTHNRRLHILAAQQLILVRHTSKRSLRSAVLALAKVVIVLNSVAVLLGEARGQGVLDADEDVALDERLGAHAGVDAGVAVRVAVVVRVDDVRGAEAEEGHARVDVLPVVVGVGDVQLARVLVAVAVALADEGCFVVVVEIRVAVKKLDFDAGFLVGQDQGL